MSYNYSKLLGAIKEKFSSQAAFAGAIGMSERTLSLKLNGARDWKQGEIRKACNILKIKNSDIPAYFFKNYVQENEHIRTSRKKEM